jgi:hypothetical protein
VNHFLFASFPFFQHLIHLLSFAFGLPSPLIRFWSSISSHSCLVFSIISLPCVFDPFRALPMHARCFQSLLHAFYVHFNARYVFLILIVHALCTFLCMLSVFDPHCARSCMLLCMLGAFNPHYPHSMHTKCYQSLLRIFMCT